MNWLETQNKVRAKWVKLTDEDLRRINGKRDLLTSTLAERYGWAKEQAERQIKEFEQTTGEKFEGTPIMGGQPAKSRPAGFGVNTDEEEEEEVEQSGHGKKRK